MRQKNLALCKKRKIFTPPCKCDFLSGNYCILQQEIFHIYRKFLAWIWHSFERVWIYNILGIYIERELFFSWITKNLTCWREKELNKKFSLVSTPINETHVYKKGTLHEGGGAWRKIFILCIKQDFFSSKKFLVYILHSLKRDEILSKYRKISSVLKAL